MSAHAEEVLRLARHAWSRLQAAKGDVARIEAYRHRSREMDKDLSKAKTAAYEAERDLANLLTPRHG